MEIQKQSWLISIMRHNSFLIFLQTEEVKSLTQWERASAEAETRIQAWNYPLDNSKLLIQLKP